jgi:hypothetical protein
MSKTKNRCNFLPEAVCRDEKNADYCKWVDSYQRANGTQVKGSCRLAKKNRVDANRFVSNQEMKSDGNDMYGNFDYDSHGYHDEEQSSDYDENAYDSSDDTYAGSEVDEYDSGDDSDFYSAPLSDQSQQGFRNFSEINQYVQDLINGDNGYDSSSWNSRDADVSNAHDDYDDVYNQDWDF